MVKELFRWENYEAELTKAFTPASPISGRASFHGRNAYMRRVINAVNQVGQHVVIYGERGVGKTSLANVLAIFLEPFTSDNMISIKVNCFRETTYARIWNAFFRSMGLPERDRFEPFTPADVLTELRNDPRKLILIVDEFDRIENPDVDAMIADTIKSLSDFAVDTTIVVVGVADDVEDLISEHSSIDRCLVQIHLPRMQADELAQIVEQGMASAEMTISPDAIAEICTISNGLPHFAHALGLADGRAAIDSQKTFVDVAEVDEAVDSLISESQQSILASFDAAVASPRRQNYYFHVLLACALAPTDNVGYFRARDIRDPYAEIMGRRYEIPTFVGHLHRLCEPVRGAILHRFGESHNFRFRFTDPMMQPFVLMHGLKRDLVKLSQVRPVDV